MASLIHLHLENYATRNVVDDAFASEVQLPLAASSGGGGGGGGVRVALEGVAAAVAAAGATRPALVIACGASASAAACAALGVAASAPQIGTVTVGREAVGVYDAGSVLVAAVPGGIAEGVPLAAWLTPLLAAAAPTAVVALDVHGPPVAVVALPGDVAVMHVATSVPATPSLAAAAPLLPPPLMLDGAPAAVLTRALEGSGAAVALRCFAPPASASGAEAGTALARALRAALTDALGVRLPATAPASVAATDRDFRAAWAAHSRRAAAAGDAMTAAVMFS